MSIVEKAKKIIDELIELTKGNIFPNIKIDDEKTKFMTGFIKLNYEDELIQSKIKDFVNTIVNVLSNNENLLKVKLNAYLLVKV